jgi:hypothetical protein
MERARKVPEEKVQSLVLKVQGKQEVIGQETGHRRQMEKVRCVRESSTRPDIRRDWRLVVGIWKLEIRSEI